MVKHTLNPKITNTLRTILNSFDITWSKLNFIIIFIFHLFCSLIKCCNQFLWKCLLSINQFFSLSIDLFIFILVLNFELSYFRIFFLTKLVTKILNCLKSFKSVFQFIIHFVDVIRYFEFSLLFFLLCHLRDSSCSARHEMWNLWRVHLFYFVF